MSDSIGHIGCLFADWEGKLFREIFPFSHISLYCRLHIILYTATFWNVLGHLYANARYTIYTLWMCDICLGRKTAVGSACVLLERRPDGCWCWRCLRATLYVYIKATQQMRRVAYTYIYMYMHPIRSCVGGWDVCAIELLRDSWLDSSSCSSQEFWVIYIYVCVCVYSRHLCAITFTRLRHLSLP